jgi:hypothetical protein
VQIPGVPLAVADETVVAFDGDYQLWQEYGSQSGSCSEECGDRRVECVAGAEGVLVVEAFDDRATASCQGWVQVAGNIERVRWPHVLDRRRVMAHSNHYSKC